VNSKHADQRQHAEQVQSLKFGNIDHKQFIPLMATPKMVTTIYGPISSMATAMGS